MKSLKNIFRLLLVLALCLIVTSSICDNGPTDPTAGLYHTYDEVETELRQLASDYPAISSMTTIGKSLEQRELWAIKISDNVSQDEEEPVVVFLGAHHAREWISVDVPFLIAEHLIENYSSDPSVARLVNNAEIWIVPMVNPDGHQYSVMTDRLWRKNRRNNGDGSFGVDLNRNYSHQWGGPGSSGDTFSETYRGPAPFSEPESQVVRDFLQQQSPKALISYHNYSQLVLYPWGYTNSPAPHKALLDSLAVAMAHQIRSVHGENYTPGQSSTLYLASGDTTDWLYALLGVPAYTIELRPDSYYPGFKLPEAEILPTFEENLPAALLLIDWAIQNQAQVTD